MARQRSLEAILVSEYVSIGEIVRLTGIRYSTLKYYVEQHILPFDQEENNKTRRFKRQEVEQVLEQIQILKKQGLDLIQIKNTLEGNTMDRSGAQHLKDIEKREELRLAKKEGKLEAAKALLDLIDEKVLGERLGLTLDEIMKLK